MATGQNGIPGAHAADRVAMERNQEIGLAQTHHHQTVV